MAWFFLTPAFAAPFPIRTWPLSTPAEQQLDAGGLSSLVDAIREGRRYPDIHSLLIVRNGYLVVEYDLGSPEWEQLVKASKFSTMPDYGRRRSGHLVIQDHGDPVWYRNIRIRSLD